MSPVKSLTQTAVRLGVQGILAIILVVTTCYMAVSGMIDTDAFLPLVGFGIAWAFKTGINGDEETAS